MHPTPIYALSASGAYDVLTTIDLHSADYNFGAITCGASKQPLLVEQGVTLKKPHSPFRLTKTLDTCTGPHESCCGAPGNDPNNCPASARTPDCDAKKACCCG